ncbi:hypothetical protein [Caminicella sporogenes]|uniref:hypothetical protein n=1 Tax=Caminicella sporogenes TaxID=166485 RepID=UPI002540ED0A|nr:hypothetical protein [Caminicella sporogenes]WIF95470.1 hypothetical protein QNI18_02170 [Caminicella sporogenes]
MIKERIEKILTVASVFFDSVFKNEQMIGIRKWKVLRVILNLIYAISISIPLGFIIQMILLVLLSILTGFEIAKDINLLAIPLFLFICLAGIVILNYEDASYSLPRNVLNFYIIFKVIKPFKDIWKTIIFVFTITIALMLNLGWFISSFSIPKQYNEEITFIIFIISLLISMIIYSETTKDEINRKKRQFMFSMLTFLVFLVLNIYQMVLYINTEPSNETIMFVTITILGLLLTMVTTIDKTRCLFKTVIKLKQAEINSLWNTLDQKYSYEVGLKMVNDKKNEIKELFKIIKEKWSMGNWNDRIKIVKIIFVFILIESFIVFCMLNQKKIGYFINWLFTNIKMLLLKLFNGNKERATLVLTVLVIIGVMVWLIRDAKKKLRNSNRIYKIVLLCRIEFVLLILLFCIKALIPLWSKFIIQYLILPLSVIFFATILIANIYFKLKELRNKNVRNE